MLDGWTPDDLAAPLSAAVAARLARLDAHFGAPLPAAARELFARFSGGEVLFDDRLPTSARARPSLRRPFAGGVRVLTEEEVAAALVAHRFPRGWVPHDHLPFAAGGVTTYFLDGQGGVAGVGEHARLRAVAEDLPRFFARLRVEQERVDRRRRP